MKALLMYRDRDFELLRASPWNAQAVTQDLGLETVLEAMAGGDEFVLEVARKALVGSVQNDAGTVLYRQEILKDALEHPGVVKELYQFLGQVVTESKRHSWGITSHYASSMLFGATDLLESFVALLRKLRGMAEREAPRFRSAGFTELFAMLQRELSEEFLASIEEHLILSRYRKGLLLSAELGASNECRGLVVRKDPERKQGWMDRFFGKRPPGFTYRVHERDESGARILGKIRDRGISRVAVALAQSAGHVLSFFTMLRTELAFYVGGINLHEQLASRKAPVCFPTPGETGKRTLNFRGLYDVGLALRQEGRVVGNSAEADGKSLVMITGANQGGKSTFLRGVGQAQLMMQSGMFVGAEAMQAEMCAGLMTHFRREEDASMKSGKFDEEMARLSEIADHIAPNAMLLFNESFAATNEREGSEIARQIVSALLEKRVKILYVTHLYEFARGLFERNRKEFYFLRAERKEDGTRSFKLLEGEPLETSHGADLYRQIFAEQGRGPSGCAVRQTREE